MPTNIDSVKNKIEYPLNKIIDIPKSPKLLHHKKRWKLFKGLIDAYNDKLDEFEKLGITCDKFESTYNRIKNKTGAANGKETVENYFNQKMSEVIKSFQTGKKKLNAEIDDLKKSYNQCKKDRKRLNFLARFKNKKELYKIENSIGQAEYALSQLQLNRAKTKKVAKDVGFVSESSFMDSIFNSKKDNLEVTFTGLVGTLIKEYKFITENLKNEKYKHISSDIIKLHLDNLKNPSIKKGFEDSKATYIKALAFSNSTGSTPLEEGLKTKITEMENSIEGYLTEMKNELLAIKVIIPGELKSLCKKYSNGLENLKTGFVKNISPENLVSTYFDMYALSTAVSLDALINHAKVIRKKNLLRAVTSIYSSASMFSEGSGWVLLCPPLAIICIGVGLVYLADGLYCLFKSPVPNAEEGEKISQEKSAGAKTTAVGATS